MARQFITHCALWGAAQARHGGSGPPFRAQSRRRCLQTARRVHNRFTQCSRNRASTFRRVAYHGGVGLSTCITLRKAREQPVTRSDGFPATPCRAMSRPSRGGTTHGRIASKATPSRRTCCRPSGNCWPGSRFGAEERQPFFARTGTWEQAADVASRHRPSFAWGKLPAVPC